MLRINLLPAYVAQRRLTRTLKVVFTVAIIAAVAILIGWNGYLIKQVNDETAAAQDAVNHKSAIDAQESLAASTLAKIGPIKGKVDFYNTVMKFNTETPDLYWRIARWTSPAIYYTDMSVNGDQLDIKGYTKSIDDLGRYLQYMYTEPDVTTVQLMSSLPNYTQAMVPVTLYKGKVISSGQQTGQQGGPTGFGGPPMGPGFGPQMGQRFGGPAGFPGQPGFGAGNPNAALMDPGLANAMATGAGTTTGYRRADSFAFEVVCTLKTPLNAPGDPGSAAGGGAAGGGTPGAAATGIGGA